MEFVTPSAAENEVLARLDAHAIHSEMIRYEQEFLNALLLRHSPGKVLELGVAAGGSSAIILNASQGTGKAVLYSVDRHDAYYKDPSRKSGFVLDSLPELKRRQTLLTGMTACAFMDDIGDGIDFCLLDTMHSLPGEVLDFLMILPYLKEECTVVLHDINLQYHITPEWAFTNSFVNCLLMSAIPGKKILPSRAFDSSRLKPVDTIANPPFQNIGGIVLKTVEARDNVWSLFNLLTLQWQYLPENGALRAMRSHFTRWYGEYYGEYFDNIVAYQKAWVQRQPIRPV